MAVPKPLRLLLIEDSENDAFLLLRELERHGWTLEHARVDTSSALEDALIYKKWDVIVCDYSMPHFNALAALDMVKSSHLDLPFLIVSGTIGEETAVEAMKAGAHDYLMKGNLTRLIPAIERELREAKVRAQQSEVEQALYESEHKFHFLFEQCPVPMLVIDELTKQFLEINESAVKHYGYSRQEFLKMKATDLEVADPLSQPEKPTFGHLQVSERQHRLKNGKVIEVEIFSDTLNLEGRRLIFAIVQDISQRKQTERDLVQAREAALENVRLKSEFLANVSHEIRTPLNGIIGMTDLLLKTPLTEKQKGFAETIHDSSDSLINIVNDILDFSKGEAGKLEIRNTAFKSRDLIKGPIEALSAKAERKGLSFSIHIEKGVPTSLKGDLGRLRQILLILVDNAIKFTEEGSIKVTVGGAAKGKRMDLRFTVEDTGIGIPESRRDRLFQVFSQVDSSLTRKYGGTGLGLAIGKQLVEQMGGTIGFESVNGKGSIFWFSSPVELAQ